MVSPCPPENQLTASAQAQTTKPDPIGQTPSVITETICYVSSLPMVPENAMRLLLLIRSYWGIEAGHHQRLDVTAKEDASRVRHRNSLLVLGRVRRIVLGFYYAWLAARKNKRQSTLKDFHDAMDRHQHRDAWRLIQT